MKLDQFFIALFLPVNFNNCNNNNNNDSLFLLRNVLTASRPIHLLRSMLCIDSLVLPLYDAVLCESLSATLNINLDDIRWSQASLPIRCSGLGVRGVVLLAPSANVASAASTTELTSRVTHPSTTRGRRCSS